MSGEGDSPESDVQQSSKHKPRLHARFPRRLLETPSGEEGSYGRYAPVVIPEHDEEKSLETGRVRAYGDVSDLP